MNYLKDVIIKCKQKEIELENINYFMPNTISPYIEINQEGINDLEIEKNVKNSIGVNPYYRNEKIFWELLAPDNKIYPELINKIFNICCHFIAESDYKMILRLGDYIKNMMEKDIKNGYFGENIRKTYLKLDYYEKEIVVNLLVKLYKNGNSFKIFAEALKNIFKGSILYEIIENRDLISIYIPQSENEKNIEKLNCLIELFLPINLKLEIFWEFHFAVIGIAETCKIDECRIG